MLPSDQHISCSLDLCRANSRPRVSGVSVLADFVQGLLHMLGMEQPVASSNTLWLDNHAEINTACQKSWKATGDHTMELIETVVLQSNLWRSWCLRPVYKSFLHLMSLDSHVSQALKMWREKHLMPSSRLLLMLHQVCIVIVPKFYMFCSMWPFWAIRDLPSPQTCIAAKHSHCPRKTSRFVVLQLLHNGQLACQPP